MVVKEEHMSTVLMPTGVAISKTEIGNSRMTLVRQGHIQFRKVIKFESQGLPENINFNEQMKYLREHPRRTSHKLSVICGGKEIAEVTLLPKHKTMEFAADHIKRLGKDEQKLSASGTGALYWNIIFHYHTFDNLCRNIPQKQYNFETEAAEPLAKGRVRKYTELEYESVSKLSKKRFDRSPVRDEIVVENLGPG